MKGPVVLLSALVLLGACEQKTETTTNTATSDTTTVSTTTSTTENTATLPAVEVDTAATAEMKQDAKDAGNTVAGAARDAAHATGTAMETAGKEIQEHTAPPPPPKKKH